MAFLKTFASSLSRMSTFPNISASGLNANSALIPVNPVMQQMRSIIRRHFPRPSEIKRVRKHGYAARLSTPGGRMVIMRRILKGRHVLAH